MSIIRGIILWIGAESILQQESKRNVSVELYTGGVHIVNLALVPSTAYNPEPNSLQLDRERVCKSNILENS